MQPALATDFAGRRWRLFRLALGTSVGTLLTLGFYRFWMKTRLRRYYWSAIRPGGVPLEYVGEPMEKLLGFLTAVVMMAFYIGIVNLVLMFASYALFHGNGWAYGLSFLGVLPLVFFAQYRARRYVLARTRWRGIRFGVEDGAWGYALKAMGWWALTILTLGILWPRKTFALEKHKIDRTWFGTARMEQTGSPWMLMNASKHLWIGLLLSAIGGAGLIGMYDPALQLVFAAVGLLGLFWIGFGFAYWKVDSFRRLTSAKRIGGVALVSQPRPWRILRHYSLGYGLTLAAVMLVATPFIVALVLAAPETLDLFAGTPPSEPALPRWMLGALGVLTYFLLFIIWGVFRQVFVTLPNMRHYAETLAIENPDLLAAIGQRGRDEFAEAEGFADALDVGAAI